MTSKSDLNEKIYQDAHGKQVSLWDLLEFFSSSGPMRISDMHLKVASPPVYRVDGALQRLKGLDLTSEQVEVVAKALLSDKEMESLKLNRSIDSSFFTDDMQFRINCFHDRDGMAIAFRALESTVPSVESIGFPNNIWRDIISAQQGLVLLTGITGAGKSTTIASLISRIAAERACRIITLEDPIEYRLKSDKAVISQREVGRDVPTFERGLRDCLREDPDVIFVGEMRDRESTTWTLTAAETGHLVFSTLHTRDARGSISRVLDMFPTNRQDEVASQLSLGLRSIISQKLIPRCDGKGRVVAMEILNNTYATANLIRVRKLEQLYTQLQTRTKDVPDERMITIERSLARLVVDEIVDPHEAEKWANDRGVFMDEIQRLQAEAKKAKKAK